MALTFREKLQSGYYSTNNYQWVSYKEAVRDPAKMRQYEMHQADAQRRHAEFEADVLEEVGLTNHPKAGKVYAKAWEMGHASGYAEVAHYVFDLAEIVL